MTGLSIEDVVARATDDDIRLVRFLYCDPAGVIRGKNVHVARLASRMREGIGMTRAQNTLNMLDQLAPLVEGMEPVGEIRITPDPDTYSVLDWVPRTASMVSDQLGHDGLDWGSCTRSFLKRVIGEAESGGHPGDGIVRERVLPRPRGRRPRRARGRTDPATHRRAWTGPHT